MQNRIEVSYSRKFLKQASRISNRIIDLAEEKEETFKGNPFDPSLDTHKLHGKEKNTWAFSITKSYRIKFIFLKEGTVLFLEIGTHDIYKLK